MLEAVAQNSAEAYRKYSIFDAMRRDFLRTYGFSIFMLVFSLLALLIRYWVMFGIMVGFAVLIPVMYYFTARSGAKNLLKETPNYEQISMRYVFSTQNMSVLSSNERNARTVAYPDFYMVYETDEYFYFYLNPKECMILPKDSFRVGKCEDLTRILKAHLIPVRKYVKKR